MTGIPLRYLRDQNGVTKLWCECSGCGFHKVPISSLDAAHLDTPIPDLKAQCPRCAAPVKSWRPDWSDYQPGHDMAKSSN